MVGWIWVIRLERGHERKEKEVVREVNKEIKEGVEFMSQKVKWEVY